MKSNKKYVLIEWIVNTFDYDRIDILYNQVFEKKHDGNCDLLRDIFEGLFCRECKTKDYCSLKFNAQDQLIFKCSKCGRDWI